MESVIDNLYIGGDRDYERLGDKPEWSTLRCCKEGRGGHRDVLGYRTLAAPSGADYLTVKKGDHMALNFIDPNDPHFIPIKMLVDAVVFIDKQLSAHKKVLIACNAGHSRGPTTAMLYLRSIGDLPHNFVASERLFRTLYPQYHPGVGMRQFAKTNWNYFASLLRKGN